MSELNHISDVFRKTRFTVPRAGAATYVPESSVDTFLRLVYEQFRRKAVLLVGVFYTFLAHCVNYEFLLHPASDRVEGSSSEDTLLKRPFSSSKLPAITIIVWSLCGVWALVQLLWLIKVTVKHHAVAKKLVYYHIDQKHIQYAKWEEIVHQLSRTNNFCFDEFNRRPVYHTDLDIVSRICRLDNYLISMFNLDILNLRMPIFGKVVVSQAMEHALNWSLFSYNFGPAGIVDKDKDENEWANKLRRRIIIGGIFLLFFSPVIVVVMLLYLALKYGSQIKENASAVVGGKHWSVLAHWKFRLINEVPHVFECRLRCALAPAKKYDDQFPPPAWLSVLANFGQFVFGFIFLILVLFSVMSPKFIYEIFGISSVVLMTVITGALGVCFSLQSKETLLSAEEEYLRAVAKHTNYLPQSWVGQAHTNEVRKEFSAFYEMRVFSWLFELLSIFALPFVMLFSLARNDSVHKIARFFRGSTVENPTVGNVCKYSLFDLESSVPGTSDSDGGVDFDSFARGTNAVPLLTRPGTHTPNRLNNQKLEMSVFSFILHYRPVNVHFNNSSSDDDMHVWEMSEGTRRVLMNVLEDVKSGKVPVDEKKLRLGHVPDGDPGKSPIFMSFSTVEDVEKRVDTTEEPAQSRNPVNGNKKEDIASYVLNSVMKGGERAESGGDDKSWENTVDPTEAAGRVYEQLMKNAYTPPKVPKVLEKKPKDTSQSTTTTTTAEPPDFTIKIP